jgi:hypothetical protein
VLARSAGVAGSRGPGAFGIPGPVLRLGPELAHLDAGDIIHVPDDGCRVAVLWKNSARHNALPAPRHPLQLRPPITSHGRRIPEPMNVTL